MKLGHRLGPIVVAAVVVCAPAFAFHDGGVAECGGCHAMHTAKSPLALGGDYGYLLAGTDQSSTCLNCHEHSRSEMDDNHNEVSGYVYDSQACLSCHPNGRGD